MLKSRLPMRLFSNLSSIFDEQTETQLPNVRKDKQPIRKFSTLIKRLIVELERDPQLYPEGNIVEVCVSAFDFSYTLITSVRR
jgi:hypothetical protein